MLTLFNLIKSKAVVIAYTITPITYLQNKLEYKIISKIIIHWHCSNSNSIIIAANRLLKLIA